MPAFTVSRSIDISAALDKVTPAIDNFANWPVWSPWLYTERSAQVDVHGTAGSLGHGYQWRGETVGAGSMELTEITDNRYKMQLTFLKPFKSTAQVELHTSVISPQQTRVTWDMHGKLPFFMFFMSKTMQGMIGMDYERGLRLLKDYVENASVASQTEVVGEVDIPAMHWIGVSETTSMADMGSSMERTLPAAMAAVESLGAEPAGAPGAIYEHMDIKTQVCRYSAIIPVTRIPSTASESGTIVACRALKVVHTGRYSHLGNGWATAMSQLRHRKLKTLKTQPPFELYTNDPATTPEHQLVTEIYLPIRS